MRRTHAKNNIAGVDPLIVEERVLYLENRRAQTWVIATR